MHGLCVSLSLSLPLEYVIIGWWIVFTISVMTWPLSFRSGSVATTWIRLANHAADGRRLYNWSLSSLHLDKSQSRFDHWPVNRGVLSWERMVVPLYLSRVGCRNKPFYQEMPTRQRIAYLQAPSDPWLQVGWEMEKLIDVSHFTTCPCFRIPFFVIRCIDFGRN